MRINNIELKLEQDNYSHYLLILNIDRKLVLQKAYTVYPLDIKDILRDVAKAVLIFERELRYAEEADEKGLSLKDFLEIEKKRVKKVKEVQKARESQPKKEEVLNLIDRNENDLEVLDFLKKELKIELEFLERKLTDIYKKKCNIN